jgi:hypothetical protein
MNNGFYEFSRSGQETTATTSSVFPYTGRADISGSLNVVGTVTINDILQLTPRSSTPDNPVEGMIAVFGAEGGEQQKGIYCYLNGLWEILNSR